jgi:acyl carrier protein
MNVDNTKVSAEAIKVWLLEKFSYKLKCGIAEINPDQLFVDFGLDSTEVLLLAGELESWIEIELPPTAMWYHPTIEKLSQFIAEEYESMEVA